MSDFSRGLIQRSGYSRAGFAERYDEHRPAPPAALVDVLSLLAQAPRPALVVDVGCGTGLSTRPWAERAERVVGVEPNADMLHRAAAATEAANVEFVEAYANATGLPDACADLVTCSQSFHWMAPEPTLTEAARILRPGGVFAAYDYDLPPVVHWEIDAAFEAFRLARRRTRERQGFAPGSSLWQKERHLERIDASGHFRRVREVLLHSAERGNAQRLVGLALSLGPGLRDAPEVDAALEELEAVASRVLGADLRDWYFGYRIRVGLK